MMVPILFLLLMMISISNSFETSIIPDPPSGALSQYTMTVVGEQIIFGHDNVMPNNNGNRIYFVLIKDPETTMWTNYTTKSYTMEDIIKSPPTVLDPLSDSYTILRVDGLNVLVDYRVTGSAYLMRTTFDINTMTFSDNPIYSSNYIPHFTGNFQGYSSEISPDFNLIVNIPIFNTNPIETIYWSGSDYLKSSSTMDASGSLNTRSVSLVGNKLALGRPTTFGSNANTRGIVELHSWNDVTKTWSSVEHTFECPARPDNDRRCYGFGTGVWVTDSFAIIHAPEISNTAGTADPNVGAYITFTNSGSVWSTGTIVFPDQADDNGRYGKIVTYEQNYALVEMDAADWFKVFTSEGVDYGDIKPPLAYTTNIYSTTAGNKGKTTFINYANLDNGVVTFILGSNGNSMFIENLVSSNVATPPKLKTIDHPTGTASAAFGKTVRVVGDYSVICSTGDNYPSVTPRGVIRLYKRNIATNEWEFLDDAGPVTTSVEVSIQFCESMDFDGSTIVVSAMNEDVATTNDGPIYVYDFDGTTITFNTRLDAPFVSTNAQHGYDLSVSGNILLVGAKGYDTPLVNGGAAVVYTKTGSVWDAGAKLDNPPELLASGQFGYAVSTDGTRLAVSARDNGSIPRGMVTIYTYNGTAWDIEQTLLANVGDVYFGENIAIDDDKLVVSELRHKIHLYKLVGGTWTFQETVVPTKRVFDILDTTAYARQMSLSGDILVATNQNDYIYGDRVTGAAHVFIWDGTTFLNDQEQYIKIEPETHDTSRMFASVDTDGATIVLGHHEYDTISNSIVGRAYILPIFSPCTLTSQCSTGQYCGSGDVCVAASSCAVHTDCIGEFRPNRLPYCNPNTLLCQDKYAGTCTSTVTCNEAVKKATSKGSKIGSIQQTISTNNITNTRVSAKSLYTKFQNTTSITEQTVDAYVSGTESASFPLSLFVDYDDDTALLNHIKEIVCSSSVSEMCTAQIVTSSGRLLQQGGLIPVQITYTISSELFDSLVADGTAFSDGTNFEQALATALGVTTDNITLTAIDGELVIEYIVAQEATGQDPLSEENLAALQSVQSELSTITGIVESELGLDSGAIQSSSIDYCTDRDCNGRGTCDPLTGICDCDTPDYWGINCETAVDCGTGERAVDTAYCICEYPEYGQRCQYTKDCTC